MNYDFGKIKFVQEYEDGQSVVHTIRGDASLDDVLEAFEYFLKGAGYYLKDGQHIGYEYDEETPTYQSRKEMYDSMDVAGGSSTVDSIDLTNISTISVDAGGVYTSDGIKHSHYYWDTERNK